MSCLQERTKRRSLGLTNILRASRIDPAARLCVKSFNFPFTAVQQKIARRVRWPWYQVAKMCQDKHPVLAECCDLAGLLRQDN